VPAGKNHDPGHFGYRGIVIFNQILLQAGGESATGAAKRF
jgi:hypothetical protein